MTIRSIPTWVRRGQKVVAVGHSNPRPPCPDRYDDEIWPEIGGIYTVRSTFFSFVTGRLCIRLVEVVNRQHRYAGGICEMGWSADSFRPLVDDANDSEVERELYQKRQQFHSVTRELEAA